jgi:hypothetical protein
MPHPQKTPHVIGCSGAAAHADPSVQSAFVEHAAKVSVQRRQSTFEEHSAPSSMQPPE